MSASIGHAGEVPVKEERRSAWRRLALVGAVGAVALIGNMRASGFQSAPRPQTSTDTLSEHAVAQPVTKAKRQWIDAQAGADYHGGDAHDDGAVVPAIYAWDPDVRFVYYRHVSKWM